MCLEALQIDIWKYLRLPPLQEAGLKQLQNGKENWDTVNCHKEFFHPILQDWIENEGHVPPLECYKTNPRFLDAWANYKAARSNWLYNSQYDLYFSEPAAPKLSHYASMEDMDKKVWRPLSDVLIQLEDTYVTIDIENLDRLHRVEFLEFALPLYLKKFLFFTAPYAKELDLGSSPLDMSDNASRHRV
ncbi:hypothetical protein ONZ43_g4679 [Nemania bipapillata]|uniref:Uncharacterized protein n=1 Tax=Nemania bipapillata TaxID=110536 RepID=A0ACC2IJL5_9PEZI|nr:hypothetical protein ONZ43_g4679 [Nemania bipapillata]